MNKLDVIQNQPPHKRAGFIDSMYTAAKNNSSDREGAEEVLEVIEQMQGKLPAKCDFTSHAEKLRTQLYGKTFPLKMINYKIAMYAEDDRHAVTTNVRVRQEDVKKAASRVVATSKVPDNYQCILPHYVADEIRLAFASEIRSAVQEQSPVSNFTLEDWKIVESDLTKEIKLQISNALEV